MIFATSHSLAIYLVRGNALLPGPAPVSTGGRGPPVLAMVAAPVGAWRSARALVTPGVRADLGSENRGTSPVIYRVTWLHDAWDDISDYVMGRTEPALS